MLELKRFADFKFGTRFKELLKKEDEGPLAEKLGLASTSAFRQWTNGYTLPTCENLYKISEYFNVSSDYLIGRTDVKSADIKIREMHDMTGLSNRAITNLMALYSEAKAHSSNRAYRDQTWLINSLLEDMRSLFLIAFYASEYELIVNHNKGRSAEMDNKALEDDATVKEIYTRGYALFGPSFRFVFGETSSDLACFNCQQQFIGFVKSLSRDTEILEEVYYGDDNKAE